MAQEKHAARANIRLRRPVQKLSRETMETIWRVCEFEAAVDKMKP